MPLGCESQLPPARVPGIDLERFTVEHPSNHVWFPTPPSRPLSTAPLSSPPLSTAPDTEQVEATFEVLATDAADALVLMSYETKEGPISTASAFGCRAFEEAAPMLCTSHRIFGPASGLDTVVPQEQLAHFVEHGFGRGRTSAAIFASVHDPLPILDTGVVSAGNLRNDILAFALLPPSRIHPLPLSMRSPQVGALVTIVVLEAKPDDPAAPPGVGQGSTFEIRTIQARVIDASKDILIYAFEGAPPEPHSNGAPVLDSDGEVIGVHISTATDAGATYGAAAPASALIEGIRSALTP